MAVKEDLRVKRTKKALADAFINLLSVKSFEDITINELCDTAGIRRATFYKHYTDKFDFLTLYVSSLRDRFDSTVWKSDSSAPTREYYVAYAKRMIKFIDENPAATDNVLKSHLFPSMLTIILERNYKDTLARLEASAKAGMKLPATPEVTASMIAGAVAAAIYTWLISGKKKDADELAREVGEVVANLIEGK